jgi:thymidylate synthase
MSFKCVQAELYNDGQCTEQCEACACAQGKDIETKLQRQFEHDFYKETDSFREEVKAETLKKAANKYDEPFNPFSWTVDQLAWHGMAENYDQSNYINGLYKVAKKLEQDNEELRREVKVLKGTAPGEEQYLYLLREVLNDGIKKHDRTGTGTLSVFGRQMKFDLSKGFPLLTTKKMDLSKVLAEYLAFIQAETNANVIADRYGFKIWKLWAGENGDLGPVYGKQWRKWATGKMHYPAGDEWPKERTIDQLQNVIDEIKTNPNSRRLIVNAWNVGELEQMKLPPCHMLFQFNVENGRLNCSLYQRSGDLFLGIPFNIAGYAALTMMIAQLTGLEPGTLTHTIGDAHIYLNHIEQVKEQLSRNRRALPQLIITPQSSINEYWFNHFELVGYDPHPAIKGGVSV